MSIRSEMLLAQLLTLAADGRLESREPIIGEPKPAPYTDKYDIAALDAAVAKRQRKAVKRSQHARKHQS